ncbi:MAG TPA: SHOCT domain-containing protein [Thermodesulfovibrionales bacterium]|nr:SHOCT domain-containing protein [Thermodesulfovibrionales bacterium]
MKTLLLALGGFVPLLLSGFTPVVESWERSFHWNWEPSGFWAGTFFLIPIFFMIALWVSFIIGIIYFVRWVMSTGKRPEMKSEETALDVLKKRYAKGEISKEEFERIKQDIQ